MVMVRNVVLHLLWLTQCCIICAGDKESYLINIDRALEVSHFDQMFEPVEYPHLRNEVKQLFLQIYDNEQLHPHYIQCLTAQDSIFYAYQVIAKELYRKCVGEPKEDFEFLRFPSAELFRDRTDF